MFSVELGSRVAWVTGGNRGIGRAAAIAFARAGCHVAIGYRSRADEAAQTVAEIKAAGGSSCKAIAVQMDVGDVKSVEAAHAQIKAELGPVEILCNSAGVIADNLFLMLEESDWRTVIDTNLMGVVHVTKAVIRDMMMQRRGRIINLSSVAGTKGGRGQSNYAATKGAVEALTRSLASELGSRGITVNCVAPGVIETEMSQEVIKLGREEILSRQLVKRFGRTEEIAAWILFVASDFGEFMTGQTIHVDGGMTMA